MLTVSCLVLLLVLVTLLQFLTTMYSSCSSWQLPWYPSAPSSLQHHMVYLQTLQIQQQQPQMQKHQQPQIRQQQHQIQQTL